tara:strand:+ start:351 stop:551 length:201 start_codon:yes stop_codon:yes gene_type:complete
VSQDRESKRTVLSFHVLEAGQISTEPYASFDALETASALNKLPVLLLPSHWLHLLFRAATQILDNS